MPKCVNKSVHRKNMMKKIIVVLLLSLAAIACKKDDPAYFSIQTNRIVAKAEANTRKIWVKNTTDWTLEVPTDAQEWLSFEKEIIANSVDTCVLVFKVNNSVLERKTEVKLRDLTTNKVFEIAVTQSGQDPTFYFKPGAVALKSSDTEAMLVLSTNVDSYTIKHQPDWVEGIEFINTTDKYKKDVKLKVTANSDILFRRDSVVYEVKWTALNKTERVALPIMQLGTGSLETDKTNLAAIYNKMGGANWSAEYRWNLSQDISTWKGVSLADVGDGAGMRVVGLQLTAVGLVGDISAELLNLPYLKILWLDKNVGVTGSVPANIGSLVLMENLRLGSTSLKGVLPVSISKMVNLFSLAINDTGNEGIGGTLPDEYGTLVNLVSLDLSDNNLDGTLTAGVGSIKTLRNIDISGNAFSGAIPKTYLNNYQWPYWGIEKTICPQRGSGFTNCSL